MGCAVAVLSMLECSLCVVLEIVQQEVVAAAIRGLEYIGSDHWIAVGTVGRCRLEQYSAETSAGAGAYAEMCAGAASLTVV